MSLVREDYVNEFKENIPIILQGVEHIESMIEFNIEENKNNKSIIKTNDYYRLENSKLRGEKGREQVNKKVILNGINPFYIKAYNKLLTSFELLYPIKGNGNLHDLDLLKDGINLSLIENQTLKLSDLIKRDIEILKQPLTNKKFYKLGIKYGKINKFDYMI